VSNSELEPTQWKILGDRLVDENPFIRLSIASVDRIGRALWPDDAEDDPASRASDELRKALAPLDRDTALSILRDLLAENGADENITR
jgi:hypothetical protein